MSSNKALGQSLIGQVNSDDHALCGGVTTIAEIPGPLLRKAVFTPPEAFPAELLS
jgi:hypothetical protein